MFNGHFTFRTKHSNTKLTEIYHGMKSAIKVQWKRIISYHNSSNDETCKAYDCNKSNLVTNKSTLATTEPGLTEFDIGCNADILQVYLSELLLAAYWFQRKSPKHKIVWPIITKLKQLGIEDSKNPTNKMEFKIITNII